MWIGAHFSFFSVLGHRIPDLPVPLFNVYPASKYALTAITQTIRQELAFQQANIKLTVRMGFPYFFPPKLRQSFKWPHKMKDFYIFHFIRYVWIIRLNTFAYRIVFYWSFGWNFILISHRKAYIFIYIFEIYKILLSLFSSIIRINK